MAATLRVIARGAPDGGIEVAPREIRTLADLNSRLMLPIPAEWMIYTGLGLAVLLAAVVCAYREGRRLGAVIRSDDFQQLPTDLRLHGTEWIVTITEFGGSGVRQLGGRLSFRQYDSRILAEGHDDEGRPWSAEGVVYRDKLCCTVIDTHESGRMLGTVLVDRRDDANVLEGMRCTWSDERNAVSVQPISFRPATSAPPAGAATLPNGSTG